MMPGINFAICFSATILAKRRARPAPRRRSRACASTRPARKELMDLSPSLIVTDVAAHRLREVSGAREARPCGENVR